MKKKGVFLLIVFALTVFSYYLFVHTKIRMVNEIPEVFDKSNFEVKFENEGTFLLREDKVINPVAHDVKGNLYILNGAGKDLIMYDLLKSYYLDFNNREIVIYKNIVNFKPRKKPSYQFIKIPQKKYGKLVIDNKIKIRIKYAFLGGQFELMQYDFLNGNYKIIGKVLSGK